MTGELIAWTRETLWRQGAILPREAVEAIGELTHAAGVASTCVVVVSHDCDLANKDLTAEPFVEVIVGCIPIEPNGNFSWAKSPRTLHFELNRNGIDTFVELVATAKTVIPKSVLVSYDPDTNWSMSGSALVTLRSWLAVRYDRVAFSDLFVDRLTDSKVKDRLAKLIEPHHKSLSAVYFDIDGGKEIDRSDGSAYELKIFLTYPPGEDPEENAEKIDKLAEQVIDLFERRHYKSDTEIWAGIYLKSCRAYSEENLTVAKAKLLNEWRYEHMSLRDETDL